MSENRSASSIRSLSEQRRPSSVKIRSGSYTGSVRKAFRTMHGTSVLAVLEGTGRVDPLSGSRVGSATGVGEEAGSGATPSAVDDFVEGRVMLFL